MKHSSVIGGSTAKRIMACPGSVALCAKMPPSESSSYADVGTLLHSVITHVLEGNKPVPGEHSYNGHELTQELIDAKITPALALLDEVDPDQSMEFALESNVHFGAWLPGAFGSADFLGRKGDRAIVLDWKFGDGVAVDAEENEQLMFYAAAAMRTPETQWVFEGVKEIECVIVQPPVIKRWVTTPKRIRTFELAMKRSVKASQEPDAPLAAGSHCRWCAAKPVCPVMTGAVDRALKIQVESLDASFIGQYLKNADVLEGWISDLRAVAFKMLEQGVKVPEWKLVNKKGVRKWVATEDEVLEQISALGVDKDALIKKELISPAQAEKLLKPLKQKLPDDMVTSVSSGTTLAPESDPRPEVMLLGQQLKAALTKLS